MKYTAAYWINRLKLEKHPEGGYFREIHRSKEKVAGHHIHPRFGSDKHFSTAIYFLLDGNDFSAFHRLKQDEIWHYYHGSTVKIYMLHENGNLETCFLGIDKSEGIEPVVIIPQNTWFAAELINKDDYVLMGCTVSPGFEFDDFELAKAEELAKDFPEHKELIERLTV